MKLSQKQYELNFNMINNSQKFDINNYFQTIEAIRNRPNQFKVPQKQIIIKRIENEPFKNIFVIKSNRKLRLRLESIQSKPVIPQINNDYLEVMKIMRNNRERIRELNNRALTIENERFISRVFSQKPRINSNLLEKLYEDNHEKYNGQLQTPRYRRNSSNTNIVPVKLPKITKNNNHLKTDANINSDNENSKNISLELKDHGHNEISHQKQGHIEGQHRVNTNNQAETIE